MKRKRLACLALALWLLGACAPAPEPAPTPSPTPTAPPSSLSWLHGFYYSSSYAQIELAGGMDAVSLGWGRMYIDQEGEPYVNSTWAEGNSWVVPQGAHLATDYLAQRSIPYNLCVYAATTPYAQSSVLEYIIDSTVRERTADALVAAAAGYSGLTVDFEGLVDPARRDDFTALIALLRERLAPGQLLYVAVPPDTWYHGYDYRALGELCDKVILMAHDYQWTRAPEENLGTLMTDTPVAPIGRVKAALKTLIDPETGVREVSKVALAISFAAAGVEVDEDGCLLDTAVYAPTPETLARRLAQSDAQPGWSEEYASPYVYYHNEEGRRFRVWYEDARSVAAKIELCYRYGVTGLSLWRLGTVPDFDNYDVWSAVAAQRGG